MQPVNSVYDPDNGHNVDVVRSDAVEYQGRLVVPTTNETKWVSSWEEFRAVGGMCVYAEGQFAMELRLPAPYKFSIRFNEKRT